MRNEPDNWILACHLQYKDGGAVRIVEHAAGRTRVHAVPDAAPGGEPAPAYLGVTSDRRVLLLDRVARTVGAADSLPRDALAFYAYPEPGTRRFWYTNDGDDETGNDPVCCGDKGASMTVVEADAGNGLPRVLNTICVGRGHHVPTFPGDAAARVYVSNLLDGTVSVVSNDPGSSRDYLQVVGAINLCEPEREKDGVLCVPNNAFPHGQVYSPVTRRIYGLNNGYGTIAVIDPVADRLESRIAFPGCSNLLLSPDGRFIVGKGADRKRDPEHVLGRLQLLDVTSGTLVESAELKDVYPSTCRFNAEGTRLYVTTAATGKGVQRENLIIDRVLVYDATAFPALRLVDEIVTGEADCGRRPIAFLTEGGATRLIFIPNPSEDSLAVVDGASHRVIETLRLGGTASVVELNFSLLGAENLYGC
ncbi:MAG: hypothetical protein RBT81_04980 [Gammaproteobacteria bacterium]|jgi:hypothetical protein|nr:hypothetical protein [Gammaproteobacteria bacterium]